MPLRAVRLRVFRAPAARPRRFAAILAALALLLVAGCGGGGDDGDEGGAVGLEVTSTAGTQASGTPTVEVTPEPSPEVAWPEVGTGRVITQDLNVRMGPTTEYPVIGRLQPDDEISVAGRADDGRWLAVPALGWVAYDPTWVELSTPLDDLPIIPSAEIGFEFVSPLHPADASVDIPVVDQVVAAVADRDAEALLALVGGPDDGEGEGEGGEGTEEGDADTETGTVPNHACTQSIQPADELVDHVDDFLTSATGAEGPLRLYAVVGTPETDDAGATFSPVFAFEGGEARQLWIGSDGRIEWFTLGCDGPSTPGQLLVRDSGDQFFWLRPVTPELLDPVG